MVYSSYLSKRITPSSATSIRWVAFIVLLLHCSYRGSAVTVDVDMFLDSVGVSSNCNPSTGECNLRSAWTYCNGLSSTPCKINLPAGSLHGFNSSLGHLELSSDADIEVLGNGATISDGPESDFPFAMTTFTNSNDAKDVYDTGCVTACALNTLIFSACDFPDQSKDTYFRLFQGSTQVAENDEACGHLSHLEYTVPANTICQQYCLHMGCWQTDSCAATVTLVLVSGTPADAAARLFYYNNTVAATAPSLALRALSFDLQGNSDFDGGAMLMIGDVALTLESCRFASTAGDRGGAVFISDNAQTVQIQNTTFAQTTATTGGAIYADAEVTQFCITDSTFTACTAEKSAGAIYFGADNTDVSITGCHFTSCTATVNGGAVKFDQDNDDFVVSDSTFTGCKVTGDAATGNGGGGLAVGTHNDFGTVQNSVFLSCRSAGDGGGVLIWEENDHFQLLNVTMTACSARTDYFSIGISAGGFYAYTNNAHLVIGNSEFISCLSTGLGGGVGIAYSNLYATVENTTFSACQGAWGGGLGILFHNHFVTARGLTFTQCRASDGGGGLFSQSDNTNILLADIAVTNCSTKSFGGGIILPDRHVNATLVNIVVRDCVGKTKAGGIGLLTDNVGTTVDNVTIVNCRSTDGGGMYLDSGNDHLILRAVNISGCVASGRGGGYFVGRHNLEVTLQDSSIEGCTAGTVASSSGSGGAIHLDTQNSDFVLQNVTISNCGAGDGGGIFAMNNDNFVLKNSTITGCHATVSGGGVSFFGANNDPLLIDSIISNNTARSNGGGVFSGRHNQGLTIVSTAITHNRATTEDSTVSGNGGGVYTESGNAHFSLLDKRTYANTRILESAHPYEWIPTQTIQVAVDGAEAYYVYFSQDTRIAVQDRLWIIDGAQTKADFTTKNWPGIDHPAIRTTSNVITVKFKCYQGLYNRFTTVADGYYGYRLFIVPIFPDAVSPTIISNNRAAASGGGLYIFGSVAFPFSMHTQFADNAAGSGGGAYLRNAIVGMVNYRVLFLRNEANDGDGGAVAVSSACHALSFAACTFTSNWASGSGGAVAYTTGNGNDGELGDNNENYLSSSSFQFNHAEVQGGAVYMGLKNVLHIDASTFYMCSTPGDGGAIMMSEQNYLQTDHVVIDGNTAQVCGGGIAADTGNQLVMTDDWVKNNVAAEFGGGICLKTDSSLLMSTTDTGFKMTANEAGNAGGGIACFGSYLPIGIGGYAIIESSVAPRGAGLYLNGLNQGDGSEQYTKVTGYLFRYNEAVTGTLYWVAGSMPEPKIVYDTDVQFWVNYLGYGWYVVTQAVSMEVPDAIAVQNYGSSIDPSIVIRLNNLYGSYVNAYPPAAVKVSILNPSADQCGGRFPYLSGSDASVDGVLFDERMVVLNSLQAFCSPGGSITLLFTALLNDLTKDIPESQRTVTKNATLSFRKCVAGETIVGGTCVVCPAGAYSLTADVTVDTVCTECLSLGSVDSCAGDKIVLADGYWRRYPTSETILPCLDALSGCAGGDQAGDTSCLIGYDGPLCSHCSEGYYRSDKKCIACVAKGHMSPAAVFFTAVGCAGVLAAGSYVLYKMQHSGDASVIAVVFIVIMNVAMWFKKEIRDLKVQMKILITTFQICSAIPVALTVVFPPQFARYLDAMTVFNLNVLSAIPVDCSNSGGYNFIDKLVMLTLAPIGLSLLLLLACVVEYTYRRIAYEKIQSTEVSAEVKDKQEKKMAGVVYRYLTLFFLLTYLVLPFVATTLFRIFLCTDLDPNNEDADSDDLFLTADMRISCTSDYYKRGVAYAAVMIVVYVVGIPSMYLTLLYLSRKEIMERFDAPASQAIAPPPSDANAAGSVDEAVQEEAEEKMEDAAASNESRLEEENSPESPAKASAGATLCGSQNQLLLRNDAAARNALMISFLYEAYEPKYWYWEVVETTRRLMLTAVLSVCGPGTSAQALLAVLLALMYIKLYGYYAPYLKNSDDLVAETGQFQIFLSFLGALVYQRHLLGEEWNNAVGAVLILINTAVFALFVYFVSITLHKSFLQDDKETHAQAQNGIIKPSAVITVASSTAVTPRGGRNSAKVYAAPAEEGEVELLARENGAQFEKQESSSKGELPDGIVGFVNLHDSDYPQRLTDEAEDELDDISGVNSVSYRDET